MYAEKAGKLILAVAVVIFMVLGVLLFEIHELQPEVKIGTYIHGKPSDENFSKIMILENNRYVFDRHIAMNYRPTGEYVVQGHLLILRDGPTGDYVFEIRDENTLIFKGEDVIKKGTVFERVEEKE